MPATRTLAAQLSCARNVVLLAYEQLLTEGDLVSRARGGTFVSPLLPAARRRATTRHERVPSALSAPGRRLVQVAEDANAIGAWRRDVAIDFINYRDAHGACVSST